MNVQVALVEYFQDVASQFNDIVCLIDSQGRIVDVNDRLLERYGHPRAALIGEPVTMLCPPEDLDAAIARVEAALRTGDLRVQVTHITQAGLRFPVEVSLRRIERNGRTYLHAVVHDLSALRNAEGALAALGGAPSTGDRGGPCRHLGMGPVARQGGLESRSRGTVRDPGRGIRWSLRAIP